MSYADAVNEKTKDIKPVTREEMFLKKIADNMSGGGGTGGGGMPADWAENDENSGAYVKNRTHYSKVERVDFWKDIKPEIEEDGLYYFSEPISLEIGETYTVNWNGTSYETTTIDSGEDMLYLGNIGSLNGGEDTGEPFILGIFVDTSTSGGMSAMLMPLDNSTNIVISISGNKTTFYPLDYRYLPSGFPYCEIKDEVIWNMSLSNTTGTLMLDNNSVLTAWDNYVFEIEEMGVSYEITAKPISETDNTVYIGNGYLLNTAIADTGEPFCLMNSGGDGYSYKITTDMVNKYIKITHKANRGNKLNPYCMPELRELVLLSHNDTRYKITVDDNGTLSATAITE